MEMVNSDSSGAINTTPRRDRTKRSSAEYMRAMASPMAVTRGTDGGSPETPSPPRHARRSSTSLGFFTSPLYPRAESKNDFSPSGPGGDGGNNPLLMPHSPGMARSRLLPPTTPKSRNAEMFLSPPPKLKSPSVYKDNGKPIREISDSLKARLNYALIKLQNGWVDKTLPELENELDEPVSSERREQEGQQHRLHGYRGSYRNEYAVENEPTHLRNHSDDDDDNANSAHSAFLKVLSSPGKRKDNNRAIAPPTSPLNWSARSEPFKSRSPTTRKPQPPQLQPLKVPHKRQGTKKQQPPSEVEAIETLMSLSSPQRSQSLHEFNLQLSRSQSTGGKQSSSTSASDSASASPEKANADKLSNPLIPTQTPSRLAKPLIVPSLQRPPSVSDLSPDSSGSDKSKEDDSRNGFHYSQQQTDIDTDLEDFDDTND